MYFFLHTNGRNNACQRLRKYGLTHWGLVTHICVGKLSIIGSDNGLSPGRRQAIIWTNAGILLIEPFETNFSEILIQIHVFSFKKMYLKISSGKWQPFCLGLNVLTFISIVAAAELSPAGAGTSAQTLMTIFGALEQLTLNVRRPNPSGST